MEADIERNAVADDSVVCHGTSPPVWHRVRSGHRSYPRRPKVSSATTEILGTRRMIEAVVPRDAIPELEVLYWAGDQQPAVRLSHRAGLLRQQV
jgi:hypothetical protein